MFFAFSSSIFILIVSTSWEAVFAEVSGFIKFILKSPGPVQNSIAGSLFLYTFSCSLIVLFIMIRSFLFFSSKVSIFTYQSSPHTAVTLYQTPLQLFVSLCILSNHLCFFFFLPNHSCTFKPQMYHKHYEFYYFLMHKMKYRFLVYQQSVYHSSDELDVQWC